MSTPRPGALHRGFNSARSATNKTGRAFSSEVEAGSRQENASNQESRAPFRFYRNGKGASNDGGRERWVRQYPHVPADCEDISLQGNPPEPRIGFPATKARWKGPTRSSPQRTPSKRTPPGSGAAHGKDRSRDR